MPSCATIGAFIAGCGAAEVACFSACGAGIGAFATGCCATIGAFIAGCGAAGAACFSAGGAYAPQPRFAKAALGITFLVGLLILSMLGKQMIGEWLDSGTRWEFLIDRQGRVRHRFVGAPDPAELARRVEELLGEAARS